MMQTWIRLYNGTDAMQLPLESLLIYGGSFDPIHLGHLKTALAVQNHFQFTTFLFLPCKSSALKEPTQATAQQRLEMLKLALAPYPKFTMDTREISRETPSFMVDTLESFRKEYGKLYSISLLMGNDAFLQLPHWHRWQELLKLAHIIVMERPGSPKNAWPKALIDVYDSSKSQKKSDLLTQPCGKILLYDAGHYEISSSDLRNRIRDGQAIGEEIPQDVQEYIQEEQLYARKTS